MTKEPFPTWHKQWDRDGRPNLGDLRRRFAWWPIPAWERDPDHPKFVRQRGSFWLRWVIEYYTMSGFTAYRHYQ